MQPIIGTGLETWFFGVTLTAKITAAPKVTKRSDLMPRFVPEFNATNNNTHGSRNWYLSATNCQNLLPRPKYGAPTESYTQNLMQPIIGTGLDTWFLSANCHCPTNAGYPIQTALMVVPAPGARSPVRDPRVFRHGSRWLKRFRYLLAC
jgi:hypothetical protein